MPTINIPIPSSIQPAIEAIIASSGTPFVVGGAVRDAVMGFTPKDFDIEVFGMTLDQIQGAVAPHVAHVGVVGVAFGIVSVRTESGETFDFSVPRTDNKVGAGHRGFSMDFDPMMTFENAARRRDFTMNAMGVNVKTSELVDPFGGQTDIALRRIRIVDEVTFAEDPLRVLRAFQFAARFEMTIVPSPVFGSMVDALVEIPAERIWIEWQKWATLGVDLAKGLEALREMGATRHFPFLGEIENVPQSPIWHAEGNVWVHTLMVCQEMARQIPVGHQSREVMALAALCHDFGKTTWTVIDPFTGNITSAGHDDPESAEVFLNAIGAPRDTIRQVLALVESHMRFPITPAGVRRLCHALDKGGVSPEMWKAMVTADHRGRLSTFDSQGQICDWQQTIDIMDQMAEEIVAIQPKLQGRHLIEIGMKPSRLFSVILSAAMEAQLEGEFSDIDGAKAWLRDNIRSFV